MEIELTGAEVAEAIAAYALKKLPSWRHPGEGNFDCSVSGNLPLMVLLGSKAPVVIVEVAPKPERGEG